MLQALEQNAFPNHARGSRNDRFHTLTVQRSRDSARN